MILDRLYGMFSVLLNIGVTIALDAILTKQLGFMPGSLWVLSVFVALPAWFGLLAVGVRWVQLWFTVALLSFLNAIFWGVVAMASSLSLLTLITIFGYGLAGAFAIRARTEIKNRENRMGYY